MAMARFNLISGNNNQQYTESRGLPSGGIESPDAGGMIKGMSTSYKQWRSIYYTFSMHYSYKSRYSLDFSVRADGSTKFGPDQRGVFSLPFPHVGTSLTNLGWSGAVNGCPCFPYVPVGAGWATNLRRIIFMKASSVPVQLIST